MYDRLIEKNYCRLAWNKCEEMCKTHKIFISVVDNKATILFLDGIGYVCSMGFSSFLLFSLPPFSLICDFQSIYVTLPYMA